MASVKFQGNEIKLEGDEIFVGSYAPEVSLVAQDLSEFKVGGNKGIEILVTLPSLDTSVCANETRKFNEKMANKGAIRLVVISVDLPFAMGRFCLGSGIENLKVGSDFKSKEFGRKYGVILSDGALSGLLARTVFVIKDGVIMHKQIVANLEDEPNYDAVFEAIKNSGGCGCGCI